MNYVIIKNHRINLDNIIFYKPFDLAQKNDKVGQYMIYCIKFFCAGFTLNIDFQQDFAERDEIIKQLDRFVYVQILPSTTQQVNKLWPQQTSPLKKESVHTCIYDADGGSCTICGKTVMESLVKKER